MRLACSFLVVGLLGCGGGEPASAGAPDAFVPDPDAGQSDSGEQAPDAGPLADVGRPAIDAGPETPPPADAGPPPSDEFVALYHTVIVSRCGGPYCHAPGESSSTFFGDIRPTLQMPDPTTARAVLVDRRLECMYSADDRIRVVPFDPGASAIMTVAGDGLCGRRHNNAVPDITPEDLAAIESWIAGGAR